MKRIKLSILAALLCAVPAFAQFTSPVYLASNYGKWIIQSQSPNTYTFSPASQCTFPLTPGPGQFNPLATNAPVYLQDATAANSEVLTPSSLVTTGGNCGVVISPSNQHFSFVLRSGTGGLQEAINNLAVPTTAYPAVIQLDRNWYTQAAAVPGTTAAAILAAATGNSHAFLQDLTTAGPVFYVWQAGTGYVAGTWVNTKPTAAAGAGAGTAPTISDAGTALTGTVNLTSGTATTTGTLFTLNWATTSQYLSAPTCAVTSIGPNAYTTFTVATAFASSHATTTVTVATTPPVASTAYVFSYSCK